MKRRPEKKRSDHLLEGKGVSLRKKKRTSKVQVGKKAASSGEFKPGGQSFS